MEIAVGNSSMGGCMGGCMGGWPSDRLHVAPALDRAVEEARKQEGRIQEAAAKASEEALARMQRDGEIAVEDMKQQKEKELEMEKAKLKQVAAELASVTEQAAALKKQLAI